MNPNHELVSEAVLARLDAALDFAAAEVASSSAAERRLGSLVSRLRDVDARLTEEIKLPSDQASQHRAANDNPIHSCATAAFDSRKLEFLGYAIS